MSDGKKKENFDENFAGSFLDNVRMLNIDLTEDENLICSIVYNSTSASRYEPFTLFKEFLDNLQAANAIPITMRKYLRYSVS